MQVETGSNSNSQAPLDGENTAYKIKRGGLGCSSPKIKLGMDEPVRLEDFVGKEKW